MGKNLTLTGMMGVGKSTIGKILAKKLNYNFIDLDNLIEEKEGTSVNLIFKQKGENYFRKIENDIALLELKRKNSVISLGGGAFINNTIRKCSKKTSTSFWLDVPIYKLIKRLRDNKQRPLLFGHGDLCFNNILIEPISGFIIPIIILIEVVLPAPFGPRNP